MIREGLAQNSGNIPEFVQDFLKANIRAIMSFSDIEHEFRKYQDSADCLLLLIDWNTIKGDMRQKIDNLNRLAQIAPFYRGDAEYYKAEIFLKQRNREEALQHYLEAIPQYQYVIGSGFKIPPDMLVRYAESLERTGRVSTAVSIYEFLLKICSKSEEEVIKQKLRQLKQFMG